MPSPDPITYKKLILVRQLYDESVIKSYSTHNDVYRIMSVVGFDLAIETVFKAIHSFFETSVTPENEYQKLLQKIESIMQNKSLGSIQDKSQIQYIHNVRNDAQHKAKYPNPNDVNDCRTYTRDFLEKIVKQVWDIEFNKISLAETIRNTEIKNHLLKAEESMKSNDYKTAVKESAIALGSTLSKVSTSLIGRESLAFGAKGIVMEDAFGKREVNRDLLSTINRMRDTLQIFALGIDHYDYMRYKKISGNIYFIGGQVIWNNEPTSIEAVDADFGITFAINAIVQIENTVGDLEKPFGRDYLAWF